MFGKLKSFAKNAQSLVMGIGNSAPHPVDIEAKLGAFAEIYGASVSDLALSDEAKKIREAMIVGTLPVAPDTRWELADIYPHVTANGSIPDGVTPQWIEQYAVYGKSTDIRSAFVTLIGNNLHMTHLAPGHTRASPLLQADVMNLLVPQALSEKSGMCDQSYAFNPELIARGLPDIWPEVCAATLMDTVVTKQPDSKSNWSERWGFWVADGVVCFDLDFYGAPDGGTFFHSKIAP